MADSRFGKLKGGAEFDRSALHWLLTNPIYAGRVKHKDETFPGGARADHHRGDVSPGPGADAAQLLGPAHECRNRYGALLRRAASTASQQASAMVHTATRRGSVAYRYYTCCNAIKKGRERCPTGSLPAAEIERAVVDQIRCIGRDAGLLADVLAEARAQTEQAITTLEAERKIVESGLTRCHADLRRAAVDEPASDASATRIADLHEQMR